MHSYIWNKQKHQVEVPPYKSKYKVAGVMPLIFMEHCVECAMPMCYKTCEMFEDRRDYRCRRFDFGQQRIIFDDSRIDGATVSFRRWAKLGAYFPKQLEAVAVEKIHKLERFIHNTSSPLESACALVNWKTYCPSRCYVDVIDRWIFQKYKVFHSTMPLDGLLLTVYNHEKTVRHIFIEVVADGAKSLYRNGIELEPGWNEVFTPIEEIQLTTEPKAMINLYFSGDETGMLTYKYFDFVSLMQDERYENALPAAKVKCVAWDLDNTLWDGVIGDDGSEGVRIKEGSVSLIKKLDEMGVIQTIVSKNTFDIAWNKLQSIDLAQYFLYPAINWGRKSQNLVAIAKHLNINVDTFAIIDDSVFERNEIKIALPQVRVYDVVEIPNILSLPEFDIPITEESRKRRESYQTEAKRTDIFASWSGDYDDFLRDCQIKMAVFKPVAEGDIKRCFELINRSNQYNVSGHKRDEEYLNRILNDENYVSYGYRVSDKYGDYGIVGFASFMKSGQKYTLTDFVMSCRVAQKKVEKAFMNFFIETLGTDSCIELNVIKTKRNQPLRDEFAKMPFSLDKETDERIFYHYSVSDNSFADDRIISVRYEGNITR